MARAHLQRELGEGGLIYLNEPGPAMRQWAWLPLEALTALEARVAMGDGGWLMVDGPAKSTPSPAPPEPSAIHHQPSAKKGARNMTDKNPTGMSRRKLLEAAGTAAAAAAAAGFTGPIAASPQNEADIVDSRLTRKVTLAFKAIALSDLCDRLQSDTGIRLAAGPSVADEKVSLFCEHTPLREVMRQLSRPFGYTWLRSRQASGVGRQALGETASDSNAQRPTILNSMLSVECWAFSV